MEKHRKKNRRTNQPISSEHGKERIRGSRKRKKKERSPLMKITIAVLVIAILVAGTISIIRMLNRTGDNRSGSQGEAGIAVQAAYQENEEQPLQGDEGGGSEGEIPPETADDQIRQAREGALTAYGNLGIANVSDSLNIRESPGEDGTIIGRLPSNGACDILGTEGEWNHIRSGEVEGYVHSQFLLGGEAAREQALMMMGEMAIITSESLNIRSEPVIDYANVVGQAWKDERYPVVSREEGWLQIEEGYISAEYAQVRYALEEARPVDQQTIALNQYRQLVVSKVNNYLNVRSSPEDRGNGNVIGKMPSYAAGEILETLDGWYHIQSGGIDGYITSDPQYTAVGQEARDLAYQSIELMAIVNTETLNVRAEPSTGSGIWTQISREERYHVVQQLDGWAQIELDSGGEGEEIDGAFISIQDGNAEVRYTLAEAIKFSPLEELANEQSSLRSRIVNYAVQFVGNPYVWGGTSLTNGADCSGFVLSVMRNFGVSLPRTSQAQSQAGTAVSSSEMQPGDLVFYANGSGTVNHVAMYIGNGQVVHASSRRTGIRISTWNYRTPKVIRRVL
ncbi:SH3 domain-containing protein [Clostridium transplantifaecale]|uniref:C40 family peptidase n=1 Tax=Clostridium transplantifaecale TaxID=2479838 RepID=UPI001FA9D0C8|nr:SH3 domain-containing protein [Clostridium transplantifaecale]